MPRNDVKPAWVKRGNLVWASPMNEPPCFMRRYGGESAMIRELYRRIEQEDFYRLYADIGINNIYPYFYKGFGLKLESRHFKSTRKIVDLAHKYGITVAPYAQFNSIMYEAILNEVPGARDWRRVNLFGVPETYGGQDYRWKPCPSRRGFVEYLKKVIRVCIEDLNCDGIFFDNFGYIGDFNYEWKDHEACKCKECEKGFREYLKKKYPEPYPFFGIDTFDYVELPDDHYRQEDPLVREYWYFFSDLLERTLKELRAYLKSLKPAAALGTNSAALPFHNPYLFKGVSDMVCWEDLSYPRVENCCVVSQVHQCKLGTAMDANMVKLGSKEFVTGDGLFMKYKSLDFRLGMAEGMAYGGHTPQMPFFGWLTQGRHVEDAKKYVGFFRRNRRFYQDVESAANVAILYSHDSFVRHFYHAYACLKGLEHICLLSHIPFDLVFVEELESALGRYDVLLVGDSWYLPERAQGTIRKFVSAGGGLYASGRTSLYDSVFRQGEDFGLADLFGCAAREVARGLSGIRSNRFGKGLVAYSPNPLEKVDFLDKTGKPVEDLKNFSFQKCVWYKLPPESSTVVSAIRTIARNGIPVEALAPLTLTLDAYRKGRSLFVHLLNHAENTPQTGILLKINPRFAKPTKAALYSPDHPEKVFTLKVEKDQMASQICVPKVQVYSVVEIK